MGMAASPLVPPQAAPNPALQQARGCTGTSPECRGHTTPAGVAGELCHYRCTPGTPHGHPTPLVWPAQLRSAPPATPALCPQPDTSKTKANSPAAEGAIFMAGLNEEVFFDLLEILNII